MKNKRWFGAKAAAESGDFLFHSLLRLLARAPSSKFETRSHEMAKPAVDSGADACWTASLNRGDDLPPCRLSILIASGSRSAMRLEPYHYEAEAASRRAEI